MRHPPIPVDVLRGPLVESRHVVYGALWGPSDGGPPDGVLLEEWGGADLVTYLRSALKPFQVLPLIVDGVADVLGFDGAELALAAGSHSGQKTHIDTLQGLMDKGGVEVGMLRCGRHRPFQKDAAREIGERFTASHNNCSGKHAAMVAWCLHQGVDPEGYLAPDHPLQRRIIETTALLAGLQEGDIGIGIDGCGVPTLAMPLGAMARMFCLLGRPRSLREMEAMTMLSGEQTDRLVAALETVVGHMTGHPLMVAGDERPDTDVMMATNGRVLTKAGAEGLWCGVDRTSGEAFAFKAVDGGFRACVPAALEVLRARKGLSAEEASQLVRHHRPIVKNHAGTSVGRIVPHVE